MGRTYFETEHQELFYLDCDVRGPIDVHIPSALGQLGYYVFLRIPQESSQAFGGVRVHIAVGGLRPDDVELAPGEGLDGPLQIPSKDDGLVWVALCRAYLSRGDGVVTFSGLPDGLTGADLLLCTWPRFVDTGQADDWLACQADPRWAPNGVPLGGIGTGKVEIGRDGRFRNFSGNNNQDMPFEEPDGLDGAFLSVAEAGVERVLATRPTAGLPCVREMDATLAFPQAQLSAPGALPGIDVTVHLAGPVVPHDVRTSSLPGFLLRWRVRNNRAEVARVTCRLAWPNVVGAGGGVGEPETYTGYADGSYRFWEAPDSPAAVPVAGTGWCGFRYGNEPSPVCTSADGFHYVAVGVRTDAEPELGPRRGSVTRALRVAPGADATADMAVVWDMPHWIDTTGMDRGLYWQNHFADGAEIVTELFAQADRVFADGGALARLFAETDLPEWITHRLINCCYPLVTNSVLFRDGRFSINEGPTEMAGCYGTIDQRLAAHPATFLLFPQLNRRELEEFAEYQSGNGGINHDLGHGNLERGPREQNWPDLTCSFVIQNAMHAWATGDTDFEDAMWPRCRKALLRHAAWAEGGGGVAQVGHGLGTSYDGYHYEGTTPYMATLWIAALEVGRHWARTRGDEGLVTRAARWIEQAVARLEGDLWNGRYYRAFGSLDGPVNENAHAGMLAGEWYSRGLAGEDVLPGDRLDSCMDALLALNGSEAFAVPPDEVTPDGAAAVDFGWLPYVESFCIAPLAARRGTEALALWRRVVEAMRQGGRTPCDTRLMYRPDSGAPSWGAYYMTAPASWLVYSALLDFAYLPGDGVLRLCPSIEGSMAVVHPLFWGLATRAGANMSLTVRKVFTPRPIAVRFLEIPGDCNSVTVGNRSLPKEHAVGSYSRFAIPTADLVEGATLTWQVAS